MPLKDPKPRSRFYLKSEKGKWFASDANNRRFNPKGIKFVLDKKRAHHFFDKLSADYYAEKMRREGIDVFVIEEKI